MMSLTDQLRAIIEGSGVSRYEISRQTGIDQATLCRFLRRQAGVSAKVLDRLGVFFGLELRQPKRKR